MAKQDLVIGIDVGGQSTKLGVVDARGNILYQSVISSLQRELDEYINDITAAINDLVAQCKEDGNVKGIGIGAPNGNYYKGTIEFAPNLKWAYDSNGNPMVIQFAKLISDRVNIPVVLTNDANAAAVGEMTYGIAKGMKNFIMITLGTGVGSGIAINGNIVYGHDAFAGELGHTTIIRDGRPCGCGLKGCLETYTSATGVARTAKEFLQRDNTPSLLRNLDIEKISSKDIYDAAKQGDKLALEIFEYTADIMGKAFANFVAFSAPEAIVLFGGLTKAKEFLTENIEKSMNENMLKMWKGKVKLLYSTLKDSDAAILGASALGWEV
jgi:glucokinase